MIVLIVAVVLLVLVGIVYAVAWRIRHRVLPPSYMEFRKVEGHLYRMKLPDTTFKLELHRRDRR